MLEVKIGGVWYIFRKKVDDNGISFVLVRVVSMPMLLN